MQDETDERRKARLQCADDQRAFIAILRDHFESNSRVDIRLTALENDVSQIKTGLHKELSEIKTSLTAMESLTHRVAPALDAYDKGTKLKAKAGNIALIVLLVLSLSKLLPPEMYSILIKMIGG